MSGKETRQVEKCAAPEFSVQLSNTEKEQHLFKPVNLSLLLFFRVFNFNNESN
jgi:hypothetical protein